MNPGDMCICQASDWINAFGEVRNQLILGQKLQVKDCRNISGQRFYEFEEDPGNWYWDQNTFKPMRNLN